MIRCVADTNIYVSALVFGGLPREVLSRAEAGEFELHVSPAIQAELRRILTDKFQWEQSKIAFACGKVWKFCRIVNPSQEIRACDDPDDDKILACAVEANAHYIVSGDDDLLRMDSFRGIRILKTREVLTILAAARSRRH